MILVVLVISNCYTVSYAAKTDEGDNTTIIFLANGSRPTDKKINILVYKSVPIYYDIESGYSEYEDELLFTLESNSNGVIQFKKPAAHFLVSVDIETLPYGYGITETSHFFEDNENQYYFNLEVIDKVEIKNNTNEYSVSFYSNEGVQLYTAFSIYEGKEEYTDVPEEKMIKTTKEVSVKYGNKEYTEVFVDNTRYTNDYKKAGVLYDHGIISRKEYVQALSKHILGQDTSDIYESDYTSFYWDLRNYLECSQDEHITNEMRRAFLLLSEEPLQRSMDSVLSESEHFKVYYDNTNTSISEEVAQAVADEFDAIDELFCTDNGFLQPYYSSPSDEYIIYLVTDESIHAYAATANSGTYSTYIKVGYTAANGVYSGSDTSDYPNEYKGVLAHEYMHAILCRYGIYSNTFEREWMHESFASWAGIAYENDYVHLRKNSIKSFLNSTDLSLPYHSHSGDYDLRHYGSCVFPLYIQQEMGGFSTIKKILQLYSSASNTLSAIDLGLQYYGYSLQDAYKGCASYNYNTGKFYSAIPESGIAACGMAKFTPENPINSYPSSSSGSHSFLELGCKYTVFEAPSISSKLSVTVSLSNNSYACLRTIRKNSSNNYFISSRENINGLITIVQTGFGSSNAKSLAIVPINVSTSGNIFSYSWSASLSSGSSSSNYKITNVGANKCLNIYGDNVTSLYNHQNVCLWSDSGSNEQKWYIPSIGTGVYIKSIIDTSYGLNVYRVGSPWNCDLYPISGNETDAQVDFIVTGSGYKIKLHNYNLYLTADYSSNGANVYWGSSSSSSYQIWRLDLLT